MSSAATPWPPDVVKREAARVADVLRREYEPDGWHVHVSTNGGVVVLSDVLRRGLPPIEVTIRAR